MGLLVDGKWHDVWYDTKASQGRFVRTEAQFRNWVTPDGSAGTDRARRLSRRAQSLSPLRRVRVPVGASHADPAQAQGARAADHRSPPSTATWAPRAGRSSLAPRRFPTSVNHTRRLYELYTLADPSYSGRSTIPILWDKEQRTIVSNESSEIVRMFNSAFDGAGANRQRLLPGRAARRDRRAERDDLSEREQRRLPRGLRDHAGRVRGSGRRRCSQRSTSSRTGSASAAISRARGSPKPTFGYSRR